MAQRLDRHSVKRARVAFFEWLAQTGDWRLATLRAGISERTARRWRREASQSTAAPTPSDAGPGAEPRGRLPDYRTAFVGRALTLVAIERAFGVTRLVTLLGLGGAGKTRVALEYARAKRRDAWCQGAWFCDLSETSSFGDVLRVMASLGCGGGEGRSLDEIADSVGRAIAARGASLWVLDGCDRIAGNVAAAIGRWRDLAPDARFLVTSRVMLGLSGEHTLSIEGLPVPDPPHASPGAEPRADPDEVRASEAVQLFLCRLPRARSRSKPGADDLARIAGLVRELEGIPLAIELAAAAFHAAPSAQVGEQLGEDARAADTTLDLPDRQRTMDRALDASWSRLSEPERSALAQCSVFRGGFALTAAETVVDLAPLGVELSVKDVLGSLTNQSLVRLSDPARVGPRLSLFEVVRELAAAKLKESGQEEAVKRRHASFFLQREPEAREIVAGESAPAELDRLAAEMDNVLAVGEWSVAARPATRLTAEYALRAALTLHPLFATRGPWPVYLELLDRAIASAAPLLARDEVLAHALLARARVLLNVGRPHAAMPDLEAILSSPRGRGTRLEARARVNMAMARHNLGELDLVDAELPALVAACRAAQDAWAEARTLELTAMLHDARGRGGERRSALCRLLSLQRRSGNLLGVAHALALCGDDAPTPDMARACFAEALALCRRFAADQQTIFVLINWGELEREEGRTRDAENLLCEAARLAGKTGFTQRRGLALFSLGMLFHQTRRFSDAIAAYRDALADLVATNPLQPLFLACQAAAQAAAGDLVGAVVTQARALEGSSRLRAPAVHTAVQLVGRFVERCARAPGTARDADAPGSDLDELTTTAARYVYHSVVRFALRLLEPSRRRSPRPSIC